MNDINLKNNNKENPKKTQDIWNEIGETANRINKIQSNIHETLLNGIKSKDLSNNLMHQREDFITQYNNLMRSIDNVNKNSKKEKEN